MHTSFAHDGPGPWILLFPLFWAAVFLGVRTLLRRTGRGRGTPHVLQGPPPADDHSPITVLGHRFAAGEIDEDEYWRRLTVLDEQFGRRGKGGAA